MVLTVGVASLSAQADKPTAIGIFLDNSGSMFSQIARQQRIAGAIVRKANPGSTVSLFGFATVPSSKPLGVKFAVGVQCSTHAETISAQIEGIDVARGQTILIDAVQSAVQVMHNPGLPACEKLDERLLVLITDGEDRASVAKPAELIEFVKTRKVKLYVIALMRDMSRDSGFLTQSPAKKSKDFLLKLAKDTGGRIVFPKDKDTADAIVDRLFSEEYVFPK